MLGEGVRGKGRLPRPARFPVSPLFDLGRRPGDQAHAILLTLQGWTSPQLAQAFGVTLDAVRHWQGWFSERGVDALHGWTIPGWGVNATFLPLGRSPSRDGEKPVRRLGVIVGTAIEDACHGP